MKISVSLDESKIEPSLDGRTWKLIDFDMSFELLGDSPIDRRIAKAAIEHHFQEVAERAVLKDLKNKFVTKLNCSSLEG